MASTGLREWHQANATTSIPLETAIDGAKVRYFEHVRQPTAFVVKEYSYVECSLHMTTSYTKEQLKDVLRQVGLSVGSVVYIQSDLVRFGRPDWAQSGGELCEGILDSMESVIGTTGTVVVPTFSYSFCKGQPFDPQATPSTCGMFSEWIRTHANSVRSEDPIFSVAAIGPHAVNLTCNAPAECFGPTSFWARLIELDGWICNFNVFEAGSTLFHYIERILNVPYRYDKLFPGIIRRKNCDEKTSAIFFCHDLSDLGTAASNDAFSALALESGAAKKVRLGAGYVCGIKARSVQSIIEKYLPSRPCLLVKAENIAASQKLSESAVVIKTPVRSPVATALQLIEGLWEIPRDIISDGYDAALKALSCQIEMAIHAYPTGTYAWSWLIPEKWTCYEARLERMDGTCVFSMEDHRLHVVSYSLPFQGEVSRDELIRHLHVHPKLPEAIPFEFKYYERDWGLCCSQTQRNKLNDEFYRVIIRSEFSRGSLKVGEVVAKGRLSHCIVLCAHLCHPAMANDDLAGVAVGVEVMRRLMARNDLRYTYRFLIVPETIGSLAWLSHNESLIPSLCGGMFLEMLGLDQPHALQRSFAGNTALDQCWEKVVTNMDNSAWVGDFRKVIGNDERQFNAPGVRVPMLSLSRVLPQHDPDYPYLQYHSSADNLSIIREERLNESVDMVIKMIDAWESFPVPVNLFKGEVFCSRYGIHANWYSDPEGNRALFDVMYLIDGKRTNIGIAKMLKLPVEAVDDIIHLLVQRGLVDFPSSKYINR